MKFPATLVLFLAWASLPFAAYAQTTAATPTLSLPVECIVGESCLVQKLFDLQPGPGRQDYRCGTLTTEDHDGIDIRLRTLADLQKSVAVVAAADGIVLRTRDGMADANIRETGPESIGGRQAGNGIVIAHGNGWETQYSHLRLGSVRVKPGDKIKAGDRLGLVGMSGNAEFPHLHFGVRHNGIAVDPFFKSGAAEKCLPPTAEQPAGLWSTAAAAMLRYAPTAIISAGFNDDSADAFKMRSRTKPVTSLPVSSPALVLWIDALGVQAGDVEAVTIRGPSSELILTAQKEIVKPALSWFSFFGKKRPSSGWATGKYHATYRLMRRNAEIAKIDQDILITAD